MMRANRLQGRAARNAMAAAGKRRQTSRLEQVLQKAVADYLRKVKPACIWFHVPNGGARSRVEAAIFKGLGVRAGVPDLCFVWGGHAAFIELKAPPFPPSSKARVDFSDSQKTFVAEAALHGIPVELCRSIDEVKEVLQRWRLIR